MVTPFARSICIDPKLNPHSRPSQKANLTDRSIQLPSVNPAVASYRNFPQRELAIFDGKLTHIEKLLAGLRPGIEAIVLVAKANGIHQISSWLNTHHRFDAIHIFASGESGQLHLGNAVLDLKTLPQYYATLGHWRQHLSRSGIVQIYSSQLGGPPNGPEFVKSLSEILDVTVAAARHPLGKGRWQLDMVYGNAPVALPLNRECIETYDHSL
ncbi:MAG: DUF4347 domain-containing protein [Cyanobacteria bacterium P01_D01_bin.73]